MKLSDYIAQLQAIQTEHGPDVEVIVEFGNGTGQFYNLAAETFDIKKYYYEDDQWSAVEEWRPWWNSVLPPESEWRTCVRLGPGPQD